MMNECHTASLFMVLLVDLVAEFYGLVVPRSNNNPKVVATFYLNQVKEVNGCPLQLVSDCGTENGIATSMQCFFRRNGDDELAGEKSHRYCSSPSNQRTEAWWSFFRRHRSNWWINLFKGMIENDILHLENEFHVECHFVVLLFESSTE